MKIRQKIDREAEKQLDSMVKLFPLTWGEPRQGERTGSYRFDFMKGIPPVDVTYRAKKQLLGGVYSLVFSLDIEGLPELEGGKAELCYTGRFLKGKAYFKDTQGSGLAEELNGDQDLLAYLTELDLLSLTLTVKEGLMQVKLSPLGGAYTYTLFPPMKYGAVLPEGDRERIRLALFHIASAFALREHQKTVGAEG